jgi:hypothetical protein
MGFGVAAIAQYVGTSGLMPANGAAVRRGPRFVAHRILQANLAAALVIG